MGFLKRSALILFFISCTAGLHSLPPDFLNPWMEEEKKRMYGYRNSLNASLVKKDDAEIKDEFGLKFRIDQKGRLSFDPLDDNWKIRTFSRQNILFHMAEADSFYKSGLYEEALSIWKAAAYLHVLGDLAEHEKRAAESAVQKIDHFRRTHEFFEKFNEKINSAVIFDQKAGRTHVFGTKTSLHLILPGAWSYARPSEKSENPYEAVFLRHGEDELYIAWEKPVGIYKYGNPMENFVYLWDYRQQLDERIKRMNNFKRNEIPANQCGRINKNERIRRKENKMYCALYEASFKNLPFYQFFFLKQKNGVYIIYKNANPADARNMARFVAENMGM